jgi:outer membrane protein OmpA-like peptidoglycan-associated protein
MIRLGSVWRSRAQSAAFAIACSLALLAPSVAQAFPVDVQVVSKVSVGKQPQLRLRATESTTSTVIELLRDDGRTFNFALGALSEDAEKEVTLDGEPGRHDYKGKMVSVADGETVEIPLTFSTVVALPLEVTIRNTDLDLEAQTLHFVASRKVQSAKLTVVGLSGQPLTQQSANLSSYESGASILLRFGPVPQEQLLRVELHVEDSDGFFRTVTLTPWSVRIPHEEVLFATNSAQIAPAEEPKLTASLAVIQDKLALYEQLRGVGLYIAGHTDTRGKPEHNRELSRRRAESIASWFSSHGLTIQVLFEGFGESAPKVKTADEVDEPQNRRVDYILSIEPPAIVGGAWRTLSAKAAPKGGAKPKT